MFYDREQLECAPENKLKGPHVLILRPQHPDIGRGNEDQIHFAKLTTLAIPGGHEEASKHVFSVPFFLDANFLGASFLGTGFLVMSVLNVPQKKTSKPSPKLSALRDLVTATERRLSNSQSNDNLHPSSSLYNVASVDVSEPQDIDHLLTSKILQGSKVHEFSGATHQDTITASGYILALLKRLVDEANHAKAASSAPILWCQTAQSRHEFGAIYGAGLEAFDLNPEHIIFAEAPKNRDLLWALEEGARASNLLAVVGEVSGLSFTESRRLSLAAATGNTPVLLLRPHNDTSASAAETRWRIAATPRPSEPLLLSPPNTPDVPQGTPRWQIDLTRCRGGQPNNWTVEWRNETHRFCLVEKFSNQSPQMAVATADTPAQEPTKESRILAFQSR